MKKERSILDEWERMNYGYLNKQKPYLKIFVQQLKKDNPKRYLFLVETNFSLDKKFAKTIEEAEKYIQKNILRVNK